MERSPLTLTLLAECSPEYQTRFHDTSVDDRLRESAREGGAQFELPGDAVGFAAFLGARLGDSDPPDEQLSRFHLIDLYLAFACIERLPGAARQFERHVVSHLPKAVRRMDSTPTFVDEIVSRSREKLLVGTPERPPRIASYLGSGPLRSFAMVVAMREAQDGLRRAKRREEARLSGEAPELFFEGTDLEVSQFREELRLPFSRALRKALDELPSRSRTILRLHYGEGVSAEALARMYGVHRATTTRWLTQAREAVRDSTRRELASALGIDQARFDSLVRGLVGGMDVSLSTFLRGEDDP
jgi:RNA polymerase sigma-70 factor (ECF subfamily)